MRVRVRARFRVRVRVRVTPSSIKFTRRGNTSFVIHEASVLCGNTSFVFLEGSMMY